jgi:hypothetical protein
MTGGGLCAPTHRPGASDRILHTWVPLGRDDVLRTVVLECSPGDRDLFDRLRDPIIFPALFE